jgi:hypothetical protein
MKSSPHHGNQKTNATENSQKQNSAQMTQSRASAVFAVPMRMQFRYNGYVPSIVIDSA